MDLIKSINSSQLNDLINLATERVIIALPGLFEVNSNAILSKYNSGFNSIRVVVNCSEKIIRQGYGEIEAIQKLKEKGVPVFDQPENLVSFIICDNKGFFLFPQSRIFLEDSHNVKNAIAMDPFTMEQIIGLFFPPKLSGKKEFEDKLANAWILSSQRVNNVDEILKDAEKIKVSVLSDQKFEPVKKAIESNPPMHPDLKRVLDYYTTNYLWIDLKFKGANFSNKTITIPKHVLPIDSKDLREKLTSNLKLFENFENSTWFIKLQMINIDSTALRKKYLHPIKEKDGMNIISKTKFTPFKDEFKSLQIKLDKAISEVQQKINEEIESTKTKFKQVLRDYYKKNPTIELKASPASLRKEIIETLVSYKVKSIDFPVADDLLNKFSLSFQEYELAEKDLNNEKLINELIKKEIISPENGNSLMNSFKGYKEKKD